MKQFTLTDAQRARCARKAQRLLSFADIEAKCIPDELGSPVAESFAEGALENAAEAMALLAKIKISLRVARGSAPSAVKTSGLDWQKLNSHPPAPLIDILLAIEGETHAAEGFCTEDGAFVYSTGHPVDKPVYAWSPVPLCPIQREGGAS